MTIFGITGQTGAGKTTVLQVLKELDGVLIDCDDVYREILERDPQLKEIICKTFGDHIMDKGKIDRKKLGALVFPDPESLLKLNDITHPFVLKNVEEKIMLAKKTQRKLVAIDAISLVESGLHHRCDFVFAVVAEESKRIERIMARDNITRDYAESRVRAQKNASFFEEHSNAVIKNDFQHIDEFHQYVQDFFINYLR